jgi:hypothetical protein
VGVLELFFTLSDAFWNSIWGEEGPFYRGVAAGIILSAIIGFVRWEIVRDRKKIRLFTETIEPSLKSSPSGLTRMIGFMGASLRLGFLVIVLIGVLASCLHSLVVP